MTVLRSPRRLAACAFLWLAGAALALPGLAQSSRVDVSGVVTDTTDAGLAGATVVLLQEADSVLVSYAITQGDGAFRLRRVPTGRYVLQITFVGFASYAEPLAVEDEAVDAGRIVLREAVDELDELVISAERIPMVVKKDTLEYNAAAFAVRAGANVEELLKRLPGVEVDRDGTIKAQGENVQKVLVDGKEFFGSDPTIATRNLPADAIEKVQVYDKKSDMAEFTGVDDGEEAKTINLSLKEDRKHGYFGNASGGFGGNAPVEGTPRYDGALSLNRFSTATQFSVIANVNNVNRQGFAIGDYISFMGGIQNLMNDGGGISLGGGVPLGTSLSDGFATTRAGGINMNHEFNEKTSVRSSLFTSFIDHQQDRSVLQQQLFGTGISSLSRQEVDQTSRNASHRLNLNADHKFSEGHDVRFRSNLIATDASLDNLSQRTTEGTDDLIEHTSATSYGSDNGALAGDASLTYRRRFEGGRSLVGEVRSNVRDGDLAGRLDATNLFYEDGNVRTTEEIAQLQEQLSTTFTHAEKLAYTEPLGKQRFLQVDVEHRAVSEDQDRTVFDVAGGAQVRNDLLSSAFERTYRYYQGGFDLRSNGETLALSAGLDLQQSRLDGEVVGSGVNVDRRYLHLLPSASVRYSFARGKDLDVRYDASTREPSLKDLQPVVDNSDPLNLFVGNPDLRPEYTHSANVRFMLFDQFTFTNLFLFARAAYTSDKIARARTVDEQLRQTVTPVNTDGDWTLSGNVSFGTPIRPLGTKINLSGQTMYNRGVEFINGDENQSKILRQTVDLQLENRDKEILDVRLGARYTFNAVSYSLNERLDQNYVNRTFYAELAYTLRDVWRFSTEMDLNLYAQDVFGNAESVPRWEAEVSRSLMNERVQIQLVALDLLNQNVGVSYTNTNTYIQEERSRGLGRYLMLKFVYNLAGSNPQGGGIRIASPR